MNLTYFKVHNVSFTNLVNLSVLQWLKSVCFSYLDKEAEAENSYDLVEIHFASISAWNLRLQMRTEEPLCLDMKGILGH